MRKLSSFKNLINQNQNDNDNMVISAINGNKHAIEQLINEQKEYLYKTAFLYTKDENEAMDICQETIYKTILNIHKLREPSCFKTWMTKILINNVNEVNRNKIKIFDNDFQIELIKDISYEKLEEKLDLYSAIDLLEEKFKTPIIFQYFQDMTIKEIAEVLECNENTVKTYLRRGKKKLYEILMRGEIDEKVR
ncbi:TPA: sigma-70 family RNA polymerase sigma factor [Clostridioides difficile]|uniref:RNA polymerase sigma-70 factor n=3 Tax=Clostridioides difficile TaxID=1496 RepID=A0AB74QJP9_CLODI|nr:sigma-70 family RNA polymerase sigma factor [Clostridioides difficile]EIS9447443.1 sigma-70 family RNA polymerase sigma factor [Clostridioides difficile]EIS9595070.1 sigma-70 family RNA polymerase sigma factor [Clostridioides difficile]ELX4591885.1 sigma-70 family RNA polymerase sigma factor [Clostridioides difficile]MBH6835582.1 sigma-70 family RNA polymerase sigma factor [Clostridioides difficile]MBZ0834569.1 sigma-70 family RNA polymerase sigma factor [Clostridioides difficile]